MTTTTVIRPLNNKAIKKALGHYGIRAMVRNYTPGTSSVWLFPEDRTPENRAKLERFFREFDIVRFCRVNGTSAPFQVNGGEYNALVWAVEQVSETV